MTYEALINQIENLSFIKNANINVKKVKFHGDKNGKNRQVWVYFEKQKYPCGVWVDHRSSKYTQSSPSFVIGISEEDKDYWSAKTREELCHWIFNRFWIYLKNIDSMYDAYVNGNWPKNSLMKYTDKWNVPIFTGLIHDGWSIQKYYIKHLLELVPLKQMYDWYNDDVKDNLYKNFGYIEYGNKSYKELTTIEEFEKVRIGF
jgi:hypothetical protein